MAFTFISKIKARWTLILRTIGYFWSMAIDKKNYISIKDQADKAGATLIAVSKTKPIQDIEEFYELGQRDFGENYVQELVDKAAVLPKDINWHFIGHLQTNKVKYIAPFVQLIHGVDSEKLLSEINKQGSKLNRPINCLLQVHIANETTKFGFLKDELNAINLSVYPFANVQGYMGMASFTDDMDQLKKEFSTLQQLHDAADGTKQILSMGMSGDYELALEMGSNMLRIGSLLFGKR